MAWVGYATPQAKRVVLEVFRQHIQSTSAPVAEAFLSTRQIYEMAIRTNSEPTTSYEPEQPPDMVHKKKNGQIVSKVWPPNAGHAIRSIRYLKQTILPELVENGLIEKVHRKRAPDETEARVMDAMVKRRKKARARVGDPPLKFLDNEAVVHEWLWRINNMSKERLEETLKKSMEQEKNQRGLHLPINLNMGKRRALMGQAQS